MNNWYSFYKDRINSTYQNYFEERYAPFLEFIRKQNNFDIVELGCGIGSVSKYLSKRGFKCSGFDLCPDMVNLANLNTGLDTFYIGNILNEKCKSGSLGVSHGVLEHFKTKDILQVVYSFPESIHYIPLDKYEIPSFGNERLLPYEFWLKLVQPKEWFLFNEDKDLCFKV